MKRAWIVVFFVSFSVFGVNPATGRYKAIVDNLAAIEAANPDIAKTFSIGTNDDDVEILGIRISTAPQTMDHGKVAHIMVATHHGNELAAPVLAIKFINDLIGRYHTAELWRGDLADTEWHIIPVLNISGYNAAKRAEHGIDPNRDYEGPCNSSGGKLKSIRQIKSFLTTRIFSGNVTVHGYVGVLAYPWGLFTDNAHTLDNNQYDQMFRKAAELNGYRFGTSAGTIYPANGCYEDYVYWKHGQWSLLLELRNGSPSDIENTSKAMAVFYDLLDSSPSVKNQFTASCTRLANYPMRFE